jgi:hypothetical protein
MSDETNAARQAAYRQRQQQAGMVLVREWVHADDVRALERKAVTLRASRERRRKSKTPAK